MSRRQVSVIDVDAVQSLVCDRAPAPVAPVVVDKRRAAAGTGSRNANKKARDVLPLPASRGKGRSKKRGGGDENLSDYLSSLGRIPLLTAEDEVRLASTLLAAEVSCWSQLLRTADAVAAVRESEVCSESAPLQNLLDRIALGMSPRAATLDDDVSAAADLLRQLDDERRLVDAVIAVVDDASAKGRVALALVVAVKRDRKRALDIRNAFVRSNLRLVVSVARRFHHYRLPLIDLIQEGNLGLIKSVHRFDHKKGFRFSTYAHWWIRQAIERAIMNKGAQVRLPVHVFDARREVAKVTRDLTHSLGREPDLHEVAQALHTPIEKLTEVLAAVPREPQSLDDPIGDDEDRTLADAIASEGALPDEQVISLDEESRVKRLLQKLSPMEIDIITRRYGLGSDDDETLEEIGKTYQLSRERVRQIQVQGLKKIQTHVEHHPRALVH
ncbi:MAG: RNA polymerase sigma factor RpoD/SigA [Deltaproteobacteria bacterium]|nr:RNA polymerase sigma factor RpoD/SigA [Deltaproteobacteria bacterium]